MKVVQLVPRLDGGGVERGTLEVARALVRAGHEAIVISQGGRLVDDLIRDGCRHVLMQVGSKRVSTLKTISHLRRWLHDEHPDIVHPRSRLPAWLAFFAMRKVTGAPRSHLITSVHGLHSVNRYSSVIGKGELVEAVSNAAKRYLLENYRSVDEAKIRVIPRGVDPSLYCHSFAPPQAWLDAWRDELPDRHALTIVMPGRITRLKGQLDFLKIVETLANQDVRVNAMIVGGSKQEGSSYIRQINQTIASSPVLRESIRMLGHRTDLREILAAADLSFSLSSTPEAFGRTALESLVLGTPVVGYAHGGVGEVMSELFPQGAVPVGDCQGAAQTAATLLRENLQLKVDHDYTLSTMCDRTLALYREVLQ